MNGIKKISNSFEETIKDSDFQSLTSGVIEAVGDSFIDDSLLKDIPILGTLIGLGKTTYKISDLIFTKKIITFLCGIKNLDPQLRKDTIEKINSSNKFSTKVGEKLIMIIERSNEYENVHYISKLFCALIQKEITYREFVKASLIINSIAVTDLNEFLKSGMGRNSFENPPLHEELSRVGICVTRFQPPDDSGSDNLFGKPKSLFGGHYNKPKYGTEVTYLTNTGRLIERILKN